MRLLINSTLKMKLSIIIPVFNEKNTIKEIIKRVANVSLALEKEIIVIDDGSFDGTKNILKELKEEFNFILLEHPKNSGKGAAIKTGLSSASGDFLIIQDADLEYNPEAYPKLLEPLLKGETSIVYGSRNLFTNPCFSKTYFLGGKFLTFIFNFLFGTKLTDINTGFKVFRKEVIKNFDLKEKRFSFCEEVTCKIVKNGYKIKEVAIGYRPRSFKEGKKIRWWRDGFRSLFTIIKYRILPR